MAQKLAFKPADIAQLYKDQALKYSSFANDSFSWHYLEKPLLDKLLSSLSFKKPKVLDAGCGMGRTLKYLVDKKIPKENITGVDISSEMLVIANKNSPGGKNY